MLSDIEIAQAAKMQPITEIAAKLGLQGRGRHPLRPLQGQAEPPAG